MEVVLGRRYRIVVRFPWGQRVELASRRVHRAADGTIRWEAPEGFGTEPYLDGVIRETECWVHGWCGGTCDVTVVISRGEGAPEP
ncbi:MAG: hypothetical protein SCH98_16420 [Deferrisomatales bacterium]|nr:hypothetical protein [Deferrisomatales bacterium]